MRNWTRHKDVPDEVFLGWLLVWGIVLTITMVVVLLGSPAKSLSLGTQTTLGLAMGGLAAVWVAALTWAALIHLPADEDASEQQRFKPRLIVLAWLLVGFVILVIGVHQDLPLFAQWFLWVLVGVTGPFLIWQYTRRRIYRQAAATPDRQSIRHILGMVLTIAVVSAALRSADQWFGLSSAMFALILSMGWIWTVMVWIMLGRWWWLVILIVPIIAGQLLIVNSLIDTRDPASEALILRVQGVVIGHHFFAFHFLALMRSSGHRWFGHERG